MKAVIFSAIGAFLVMFLLSATWNSYIVAGFVEANVPILRETPNLHMVMLGYGVLAVLMSYLYGKFDKSGNLFLAGLKFGVFVGLLWILPINLILHGVYEFPQEALIIDTLWALVEQGAGGVVIAYVYSFLPTYKKSKD